MPADTPPPPPRPLPAQLTALRADLRRGDYTVERTETLLGELAVAALRRENPLPARRALAGSDDPAAILYRVFTLGAALPASQVEAALPNLRVAGALELGIVQTVPDLTPDGEQLVRATIDLSPYSAQDDLGEIHWWIASDLSELATGHALHPEHVLGVGGASLTLATLTPRDPVESVLDLGCGSGIQALHASRHATRIVATDLSARALAFARFTTALNGVQIELRQGSLWEPVAREQFDLIISNPPFVITPRSTGEAQGSWTYRDGGRAGDALLAELLGGLPAHLAPGGRAVMLANWEIPTGAAWDEHPRTWLRPAAEQGVDAWVIQRESEDPAQYAETWARDGGVTARDPQWEHLLQAWLDDFALRDVERIGFGYVLARRPTAPAPDAATSNATAPDDPAHVAAAARPGRLRTEQVSGSGSGTLSAHLTRALTMIDALAELDDDALAASRPVRAADVVERRHLSPGQYDPMLIELVQGAGFARAVPADQVLAATVGALDGTLTLGQVLGAVCALTGDDPQEARERILPRIRDLLITGMLDAGAGLETGDAGPELDAGAERDPGQEVDHG
jgi:methylase of polypeptide subunit release factors